MSSYVGGLSMRMGNGMFVSRVRKKSKISGDAGCPC